MGKGKEAPAPEISAAFAGAEATAMQTAAPVSNDLTPPVISNIQASDLTSSSATITWTTDEVSDSQVEYGKSTSYGNVTSIGSPLVTAHNVSLSGLDAQTTYNYRVRSKDAAGNQAVSSNQTFITAAPPDTTKPQVSITSPSNGSSVTRGYVVTINAQATDNIKVSKVEFYVNGSLMCTDTVPEGANANVYKCDWRVPKRNSATYRLEAVAYDTSNNFSPFVAVSVTSK